jgi:hypothetical protein
MDDDRFIQELLFYANNLVASFLQRCIKHKTITYLPLPYLNGCPTKITQSADVRFEFSPLVIEHSLAQDLSILHSKRLDTTSKKAMENNSWDQQVYGLEYCRVNNIETTGLELTSSVPLSITTLDLSFPLLLPSVRKEAALRTM